MPTSKIYAGTAGKSVLLDYATDSSDSSMESVALHEIPYLVCHTAAIMAYAVVPSTDSTTTSF
jgi:hypothetical protein